MNSGFVFISFDVLQFWLISVAVAHIKLDIFMLINGVQRIRLIINLHFIYMTFVFVPYQHPVFAEHAFKIENGTNHRT